MSGCFRVDLNQASSSLFRQPIIINWDVILEKNSQVYLFFVSFLIQPKYCYPSTFQSNLIDGVLIYKKKNRKRLEVFFLLILSFILFP